MHHYTRHICRWREVRDSSQSFSSDTLQGISSEWSGDTTELVYIQFGVTEFSTSVYSKPTFTGQYLCWNSFSPHKRKINLIGTLVHRAFMICSKGKLDLELDKILSILLENGYPENLNKSTTKRKLNNLTWTRSTQWKNAQFTYTFHGSDTFRWSSKNRSRLPWSAASFPSNHMLFLRPDSSYQQQRKTCYLPTIKTT